MLLRHSSHVFPRRLEANFRPGLSNYREFWEASRRRSVPMWREQVGNPSRLETKYDVNETHVWFHDWRIAVIYSTGNGLIKNGKYLRKSNRNQCFSAAFYSGTCRSSHYKTLLRISYRVVRIGLERSGVFHSPTTTKKDVHCVLHRQPCLRRHWDSHVELPSGCGQGTISVPLAVREVCLRIFLPHDWSLLRCLRMVYHSNRHRKTSNN